MAIKGKQGGIEESNRLDVERIEIELHCAFELILDGNLSVLIEKFLKTSVTV